MLSSLVSSRQWLAGWGIPRRSRIIRSRSPPRSVSSASETNPAETHAASSASNNVLFYPPHSFEMLKEAQQEEASRLGSKSSFDLMFSCVNVGIFTEQVIGTSCSWWFSSFFFCLLSSGSSSYYNCSPFCSTLIPISSSLPFACRRNTTVEISVENKASPSLLSFSSLCHISFILLDNGSHPAGSGSLGEADAGPVHLPHRRQLDQRPVRPHWHRDCHHRFRPVWMLRHLQRKPMDAEAGKNL